ncbi:MAG: DUF438 domain-containing protein [Brevinema sp.]
MSEFLNNREHRAAVIKDILLELHQGKTVDDVRGKFEETFGNVSYADIVDAEQALIESGVEASEIQSLCDVHAAVFKDSLLNQMIGEKNPLVDKGHPVNLMKAENRLIEEDVQTITSKLDNHSFDFEDTLKELLSKLTSHYSKKANSLFAFLESHGVSAPTQVMWGVDNEIRAHAKNILEALASSSATAEDCRNFLNRVTEMIFKEENILFPMALDKLTHKEWVSVSTDCIDLGYFIKARPMQFVSPDEKKPIQAHIDNGVIVLPSGNFHSPDELAGLFSALPFDITFVGADNKVRFFSQTNERIFPRSLSIIGRDVSNCHPPASVHIVEQIVEDLKSGRKNNEDFWIPFGDKFILIRYFAVRNPEGEYLGTVEVTQDIKPIQAIQGQKRLVAPGEHL